MTNPLTFPDIDPLALLRLLHLADSALPVGAMSHSFGLETMIAELGLEVADLPVFLGDWLSGTGSVEAVYCMQAWSSGDADSWCALNAELSARKPARENRDASLAMGRRFLRLANSLINDRRLAMPGPAHYATSFGLVSGVLGIPRRESAAALLHQSLYGAISACQRLLPLGQSAAAALLWEIKPRLLRVAACALHQERDDIWNPQPMLEVASMRHPRLSTRLFIS